MKKNCVLLLTGAQAYDRYIGVDNDLLEGLKKFFAEHGYNVHDMLFNDKGGNEK